MNGILFRLVGAIVLSLAVTMVRAEDCSRWNTGIDTFDRPDGMRLGMALGSAPVKYDFAPKRSGPRFVDGQSVRAYSGKGITIETIGCSDGSELVIGLMSGDFIFNGKTTVSQFIARHESDLADSGVQKINTENGKRELVLWGIKARIDGSKVEGLADYLILSRTCVRHAAPDAEELCGMMYWQVHQVRSRTGG